METVLKAQIKKSIPEGEIGYELKGNYVVIDVDLNTLVTMPENCGIWVFDDETSTHKEGSAICVLKKYLENYYTVLCEY